MKFLIFSVFLILVGCSSSRTDWDSGADSQKAYQEERNSQNVENSRMIVPSAGKAGVNQSPF